MKKNESNIKYKLLKTMGIYHSHSIEKKKKKKKKTLQGTRVGCRVQQENGPMMLIISGLHLAQSEWVSNAVLQDHWTACGSHPLCPNALMFHIMLHPTTLFFFDHFLLVSSIYQLPLNSYILPSYF